MLRRLSLIGLLLPAMLLAGCEWSRTFVHEAFKTDKVDYKNPAVQGNPGATGLELPADLSKPPVIDRYLPPGDGKTPVAASAVDNSPPRPIPVTGPTVNPNPIAAPGKIVRVERSGSERWLVVAGKPDQYWDTIKEFWQDTGFAITVERPEAGVMETDWAEHKGKKGDQGIFRKILSGVADMMTSNAERDKFRTRLEPNANGETEIYISHNGMEEVYRNEIERDQTIWTPRPPDPALEAEFLRRLMVRLGSSEQNAAQSLAAADKGAAKKSKIVREGSTSVVEVDEGFDRAWRRVGLALDRVGFPVEDRDRAKGLYFVRYADPNATAPKKKAEGMFSGIRNWFGRDNTASAEQYQIHLSNGAPATRVTVLSKAGSPDDSQTSQRILSLLNAQLE